VEIPVTLPSAGHEVWVVRDNADAEAPLPPASPAWRPAALEGEIHAYRRDANAIALDYCSVETPARRAERIPVTEANRIVWQDHGFDIDIWDRSVQFSDSYATFVDQFGDESGFTLEYFFHIEEGDFDAVAAAGVTLAVERPELYEVAVNGRPAAFTAAAPWFDEAIRAVDVSAALRPGPNTVTMRANPFHILCEPAPVYLTGDFGARPHSRGFALCAASPLGVGDWTRQGLPMYAGAVRYVGTVDLAEGADRLRVGLPEWAGAVAQVFVDERAEGYIAFPPYRLEVERALSPGKHQVAVAVYGTLRNLMGPHFGTRLPGYAPGPFAWLGAPATQPAGADYELDPYGLTAPFTVETA
jgi:hypothetical protein